MHHAGRVDILINNAGISQRGLFEDTDFDVYRQIMEVDSSAGPRVVRARLDECLGAV